MPRRSEPTTDDRRRVWHIDVCRTCEAIAHWPFCAHRDNWTGDRPWYVTIRVTGRMPVSREVTP